MGMKGFTLFTGGGGVDIAMESLGVEVVGGIEYVDAIAAVARENGFKVTTADILQCDPADFPAMDWLHASPPCPNFSVAKKDGKETDNDIALSKKIIEFIMSNLPKIFTLENVYQYRKGESWAMIENALHSAGYWVHLAHVNFADYGVPQTRKRMIVRAIRHGGFVPYLQPTHDKYGRNGLPKWVGWYEAIEDLIPDLPDSKFANWQLKRLPKEFRESTLVSNAGSQPVGHPDRKAQTYNTGTPALPITTQHESRLRAFIAAQGSYEERIPVYKADEPHGTVTANSNQTGIKAFTNGRIVKMTVRALARFQTFPDWYKNPTTRIIGNAVPPVGFANVMRGMIQ